jgi:hypothetical protein
MSIENALRGFINSREAGAFVLQGKWGLGKTYFWRQRIIKQFLADPKIPKDRKHYSYVSMFGIESLADLKAAIFQAANEFDSEFLASGWRFVNPRWWWWKIKQILPHALDNAAIPYVREGLAKTYNALTFFAIRDRLICLDDIERRGSNLRLLDVLGLVSQLAEQRACRVVLILNTGALEQTDQETWNKHKEKVFLGEMTYSPSIAECIDLGLEDAADEPWAALAKECLLQLNVSNIRIVHRAKKSVRMALASVEGRPLREETVDRIVRVLIMLEFAQSGRAEGAPPVELVLRTGPFDYALFRMQDENRTEEEKAWLELISNYDVFFGDDLDLALANMVRVGFPDQAEIRAAIQRFEDQAKSNADKEAWHHAWHLYHDTFAENTEELLDTFERVWPPVSSIEHANNLQSLVRLFRSLGQPEVASRFIREWVGQRGGDRMEELGQDHFHMFGPITDAELVDAMNAAYAIERRLPDLTAAIKSMASDNGMHRDSIAAIAAAQPEEIIQVLDANPGRYLSGALSNILRLADHPQEPCWSGARETVRAALTEMARRSPLMADRMSNKFGIRLDAQA